MRRSFAALLVLANTIPSHAQSDRDRLHSDIVDLNLCPTDYHATASDPDWVMSPAGATWGRKCYRDATAQWGLSKWATCSTQ